MERVDVEEIMAGMAKHEEVVSEAMPAAADIALASALAEDEAPRKDSSKG